MPKPRRKKRLVLDIGSSAIRLAELTPTKESYQLSKYYQKETLFDPAMDEEERLEKQLEALEELLKESKSRRGKSVIAVPGQSVFMRNRPLPPVPEHKVAQIVRYEIQQQIPFSLDQISLDYQILDRNEAGGYEVMMTAIKVDVVEKQLELLKRAKCGFDVVDVSPLAAYNWLEHTGEFGDDDQCVALIDLGATTTDIVIRKDGQFKFTRSLHTGGNDITQLIAREFNMTFEEAERLKRERGFAPTGDAKRDGKGGEVIGRILSRLVAEINRSIAYFRSQPGGGPVQRVILAGGGACMRNIVPYLQRQLNIEVRIAQPLAGLAISPGAQAASDHPEQSCVALGLALRCVEEPKVSINLIPPRFAEAARKREQLMYWAFTMVVLVLILGARVPMTAKNEQLAKDRIERLNQVLAQYDPALVGSLGTTTKFDGELAFAKNDVQAIAGQVKRLDARRITRGTWVPELKTIFESRPRGGGIVLKSIEAVVFGGENNTGIVFLERLEQQQETVAAGGEPAVIYAEKSVTSRFPGINPMFEKSSAASRKTKSKKKREKGADKKKNESKEKRRARPPAQPNGFILFGYASSLDSITRYAERLKASGAFVPEGVRWDSPYTDRVSLSTLDRVGSSRQPDSLTSENSVLRFHIDVQFLGDPIAPGEKERGKKKR